MRQSKSKRKTHLQPEDSVDSELGEVVLVGGKDLGRKCCSGDSEEVLTELDGVLAVRAERRSGRESVKGGGKTNGKGEDEPVVLSRLLQRLQSGLAGDAETFDDTAKGSLSQWVGSDAREMGTYT
jgi:hypothetical protein